MKLRKAMALLLVLSFTVLVGCSDSSPENDAVTGDVGQGAASIDPGGDAATCLAENGMDASGSGESVAGTEWEAVEAEWEVLDADALQTFAADPVPEGEGVIMSGGSVVVWEFQSNEAASAALNSLSGEEAIEPERAGRFLWDLIVPTDAVIPMVRSCLAIAS